MKNEMARTKPTAAMAVVISCLAVTLIAGCTAGGGGGGGGGAPPPIHRGS